MPVRRFDHPAVLDAQSSDEEEKNPNGFDSHSP